jgi:dTDP-4-dehydrorhamnose 3,5-epimerase
MKILATAISEVKIIEQFQHIDDRGLFVKTYHKQSFKDAGIDFEMEESFYSISKQNVIRGMHFHHAPNDHAKIVFCTNGSILDCALDIRKDSPTFGQYVTASLSLENNNALYIPKGFAHGFATKSKSATTFYFVSGMYNAASDDGILYNSFGLDWGIDEPILNTRDLSFKPLNQF